MASTAVARKYTNISFDDIRQHLMDIVRAKEGPLADLGDSAYGKMMLELFAGYGDLTANWVESGFENAFLETAYSKPAIYTARSGSFVLRARFRTRPYRRGPCFAALFFFLSGKNTVFRRKRFHFPHVRCILLFRDKSNVRP